MTKLAPSWWRVPAGLLLGAALGLSLAAWLAPTARTDGDAAIGRAYLTYILGFPTSQIASDLMPRLTEIRYLGAVDSILPLHYGVVGLLTGLGWHWRASRRQVAV